MTLISLISELRNQTLIWEVAAKYPHLSAKCYTAAKCICRPVLEDTHLCEHCGGLYTDQVKQV